MITKNEMIKNEIGTDIIPVSSLRKQFTFEEFLTIYKQYTLQFITPGSKKYKIIEQRIDNNERLKTFMDSFNDCVELWSYDDIGFLCGSNGFLLLDKDTKTIVASYTVERA